MMMNARPTLLAMLAAIALLSAPAIAASGGNGNGQGQGAGNGNGNGQGQGAGHGNGGNSANAGAQSHGHGLETSTAAKDPATRGLSKALSVVGTTPASPQATESLMDALGRFLGRKDSNDSDE